jgi:hypothetical protein
MPSRDSCLGLILIPAIALGGCAPGEEEAAPLAPTGVSATAGDS